MILSNLSRWTTVLAVVALLAATGVHAKQPDDEAKRALAERLVELQGLDAFFQKEWDFQMQRMEESMEEFPEAQVAIPEGYMEAMRQQQVDGQISDWVEAWAKTFDENRLRELIDYLEHPESQAWVDARLEAYPYFLDSMARRAEAMVDVFQEEYTSEVVDETDSAVLMEEVEPVVDSGFEELLEFAPGSRVPAQLDSEWFSRVRVPVSHPVINDVFPDLEVRLIPDGEEAARVAQVSAERAFSDIESCEDARAGLERILSGYFPETEETDCGHVRYMAAGGDIRMILSCGDQEGVAASRLRLHISHKPTEDSAHRAFMTQVDSESPRDDDERKTDDFRD